MIPRTLNGTLHVDLPRLRKLEIELEQHQLWLADCSTGVRLDLSGEDFGAVPLLMFQGFDLRHAILRGVRLCNSSFRAANLAGVDLTEAVCYGCDFSHANLQGAITTDAALCSSDFRAADLRGIDLRETNLKDSCFVGTDMTGALLPLSLHMCPVTGSYSAWKKCNECATWVSHCRRDYDYLAKAARRNADAS